MATDGDGLIPSSLETILKKWPADRPRPKVCRPAARLGPGQPPALTWVGAGAQAASVPCPQFLYTIPNGSNPTGGSLTLERKQRVYQLARDYNLLILEDGARRRGARGRGGRAPPLTRAAARTV